MQVACEANSKCAGVFDHSCDGKSNGEYDFALCKAGPVKTSAAGSCVHEKAHHRGVAGVQKIYGHLLFSCTHPAMVDTFSNTWPGWYEAGGTLPSGHGNGKRQAYDRLALTKLKFVVSKDGERHEASATLPKKMAGKTMLQLLQSVGLTNVSRNDGSDAWNYGHGNLTWDDSAAGDPASTVFVHKGFKLGVGDGSKYDPADYALFMFQSGNAHRDFSSGALTLGGEGATTNDPGVLKIEMYGYGDLTGLDTAAWKTLKDHSCWGSSLGTRQYSTVREAAVACELNDDCSGLHDVGCFHTSMSTGLELRLCNKHSNYLPVWAEPRPCIIKRPNVAAVRSKQWSHDTPDGRWCSSWCCCDKSGAALVWLF